MTLRTPFTEYFSVRHPIALAPMGGSAGGALAAAVSNGGGLGLVGGGRGDRDWLARELPVAAEGTTAPWGVGFQCWSAEVGTVEFALGYRPRAVMLSFGDPRPFIGPRPRRRWPGPAGADRHGPPKCYARRGGRGIQRGTVRLYSR